MAEHREDKMAELLEGAREARKQNLPPTDCDLCRKIMWKFRDRLESLSRNAGGHLCWPGQGERGE